MRRTAVVLGLCSLLGTLLVAPGGAIAAPLPAAAISNVTDNGLQPATTDYDATPAAVVPDLAYTNANGGRVELYSSIGSVDDKPAVNASDTRQIIAFSNLLATVPTGKQLYTTIYNGLWDAAVAKYNKDGDNLWKIYDSSGNLKTTKLFSPTQAFVKVLNGYPSIAEAKKYVHVLGNKQTFSDAKVTGSSLISLLEAGTDLKLCGGTKKARSSCLITTDDEALMHAKYSLLEQARDSNGKLWDNVVWITSANLNGASGGHKSNVSVALYGDADAYSKLKSSVWDAEWAETFTAAYKVAMVNGVQASDPDFVFYPSPRNSKASDVPPDFEAEYLAQAAKVANKTDCKASVVQSLFSEARVAILDGLADLQSDGCVVRIVLGTNAISDIIDTYFSMSGELRAVIDRVEFANVHDKTMTVSYTAGGSTTGVAWGGSENFNGTSLRYDELAFRANNLTLTRAIERQTERLYLLARSAPVTPVTSVTVSPATTTVKVGATKALKAKLSPTSASLKKVTWASSDTSVATVDSSGTVTGKKAGAATITVTSVSGVKKGTAAVTVGDATDPTEPDPDDYDQEITASPVLSMPVKADEVSKLFKAVVTWGEGENDISGKVQLQYYKSGTWKDLDGGSITVTNGRGVKDFSFKASHTWRLKSLSVSNPSGYGISDAARYSNGYSMTVSRTGEATGTPKIYTTNLVKASAVIPFLVQWKSPYSCSYPRTLRVQYYTGKKWKTADEGEAVYTFAQCGQTQLVVGATAGLKTQKWRVATGTKAVPKGAAIRKSKTVTVKVVS